MAYPDRATAEKELILGKQLNPGGWVAHSHFVALAAERIAAAAGMDSEKACILGLLHDIGRRCGIPGQYHIYAGYAYSLSKGWARLPYFDNTFFFA
jgi:HD superfamily phosphohydrolase YqeK